MISPGLHNPTTAVLLALVAASAVTDILTAKVYNALTYPGIILGFGFAFVGTRCGHAGMESAVGGALVGAALFLAAWAFGGMGLGDAKLATAIGALTGPAFTIQVILYGAVIAAALGLCLVIARGEFLVTMRRLASAAGVMSPAPVPSVPQTVPGGLCLCLAVVWSLMELSNGTTLWDALTARV